MFIRNVLAMGTVFNFFLDSKGKSTSHFEDLVERCADLLGRLEQRFSPWIEDSEVSRFRRDEVEEPSELFDEVMLLCYRALEVTGGYFDCWTSESGYDPTGLVKGWAIEKALSLLASAGVEAGGINGGGDIALLPGWRQMVGVQHPNRSDAICGVVEVESAVATSGVYQRGNHLYNPFGGDVVALSATVVGAELWLCDAFATALCVGGDDVLFLLERYPGYEGFFIDRDEKLYKTSGLDLKPGL
jgi:thiamine biosynthesis lipoprotein